MVAVVSSNPTVGNLIFGWNFLKPHVIFMQKCQISFENENLEWILLMVVSSMKRPID